MLACMLCPLPSLPPLLSARHTDTDAPAIFIGSHYDTVVDGGKYDGALGIVAGVSAVKALLLEVGQMLFLSLLSPALWCCQEVPFSARVPAMLVRRW